MRTYLYVRIYHEWFKVENSQLFLLIFLCSYYTNFPHTLFAPNVDIIILLFVCLQSCFCECSLLNMKLKTPWLVQNIDTGYWCDYICILLFGNCVLPQNGLQSIHLATCSGHLNVVSMLVEKFGIDPQETSDVRMYLCTYMCNNNNYVYACVCMFMCVCVYVCVYTYLRTYVRMYVCMYDIRMYVRTYEYTTQSQHHR